VLLLESLSGDSIDAILYCCDEHSGHNGFNTKMMQILMEACFRLQMPLRIFFKEVSGIDFTMGVDAALTVCE
jgi:uncharacterized protein YggT (Ycf19 family)